MGVLHSETAGILWASYRYLNVRRSTGGLDTTTPERNATVSGLNGHNGHNGLNGLTWEDKAVRIDKPRTGDAPYACIRKRVAMDGTAAIEVLEEANGLKNGVQGR